MAHLTKSDTNKRKIQKNQRKCELDTSKIGNAYDSDMLALCPVYQSCTGDTGYRLHSQPGEAVESTGTHSLIC